MTLYDVALWFYWPSPSPEYVEEVSASTPLEAVALVMFAYDLECVARIAVRPVGGEPVLRYWSAHIVNGELRVGGMVHMPPPVGL